MKILFGVFVLVLLSFTLVVAEEEFGEEVEGTFDFEWEEMGGEEQGDSLGLWNAEVLDQTPPTVPAIALEQASDARVRLFLKIYPLSFESRIEEYQIHNIWVEPILTGVGVADVEYRKIDFDQYKKKNSGTLKKYIDGERELEDLISGVKQLGIATVNLERLGDDRQLRITDIDEAAEEACLDESNTSEEFFQNIPDEIELEFRVVIDFFAKKVDGSYLTPEEFYGGQIPDVQVSEIEETVKKEVQKMIDSYVDANPGKSPPINDVNRWEKEVRARLQGTLFNQKYPLRDVTYIKTKILIDKTNIRVTPEKLREQICGTIKLREDIQNVLKEVQKIEGYAKNVCLYSMMGATVNLLFLDNPCNSLDMVSLGCDWIFCPSTDSEGKDLCNGVNPFSSLLASTAMCWKMERFFNKELTAVKPKVEIKMPEAEPIPLASPAVGTKYTCTAKDDKKAGFLFPHYACISGITGHLEVIDLMIGKYQECLINARYGGVSIGVCDKIRSYYLCDRIFGSVLTMFQAKGTQGLWGNFLSKAVDKVVSAVLPNSPRQVKGEYNERVKEIGYIGSQMVDKYKNVPFLQLFVEKDKFMVSKVCNAFVDGEMFNLNDLKGNMLEIELPDSFYVLTDKKEWDFNDDMSVNEFSYDVFYQIYSGKGEKYSWDSFEVYLRGVTLPNEEGAGGGIPCTIVAGKGQVPAGELAQDNVFRVSECNANTQCLRFRGKEHCSNIRVPLSPDKETLDPFGLFSMMGDDVMSGREKGVGNGVPDFWEALYGVTSMTSDDDGDGYCAAQEFICPGNGPLKFDEHLWEPGSLNEEECRSCGDALKLIEARKNAASGITTREDGEKNPLVIPKNSGTTEIEDFEPPEVGESLPSYEDFIGPELGPGPYMGELFGEIYDFKIEEGVTWMDSDGDTSTAEWVEYQGYLWQVDEDGFLHPYEVLNSGVYELTNCNEECPDEFCICKALCCIGEYGSTVAKYETCGGRSDERYLGNVLEINQYNLESPERQAYLQKIFFIANKYNVPKLLSWGLVLQESNLMHCCSDHTKTGGTNCVSNYNTETCHPEFILESYDGSSLGIMQINKNAHPSCYNTTNYDNRSSHSICRVEECRNTNAYNIDCNIAAGMNLLKREYGRFENGCKFSEKYISLVNNPSGQSEYVTFWNGCNQCQNSAGQRSYSDYCGWDASLRAYNGWACRDNIEKDYVEKVIDKVIDLKGVSGGGSD
ncbi:MAG: hypothetical protein ABIJ20_01260 [Nanoarchaeota archaeon]|nr:hypothetical protein [Nanoarchaeota archaeon]MBU1444977.1 hypothetical protein [Nanoarchaeota archaeon]MBU2406463.1 hypothetical protein [Nanoarchaeota archaeon]MBU2420833.1 hypothetical protein [Nanoarchaeota archaeon]MBU2475809.1 hypothetical protein [Nanoarchaeota archaeon]